MKPLLLTILCAGGALAQQGWDITGLIGYGVYRDVRINSAAGSPTAGIRDRFVAGVVVSEDKFRLISGEVRYVYQDGDPFLSNGSLRANIQGQSHAVHYDVLFHPDNREARFRPYVAAGVGGKYYRTSGPAPVPQPFAQSAILVNTSEWKFLADVGAGFKYRMAHHVMLRVDFRDYITPFPKRIFAPVGNATDRGLFQQFTPTAGIGYWF